MGKVVRAVVGVVTTVVGVVTGNPALIVQGIAMTFSAVTEKTPKPTANQAAQQRLSKSLVPEAARKIVFGKTAVPTDIRFWETYGTNNTSYVEVLGAATHKMTSFGTLWIDDEVVPFSGENATGKYAGALKRYTTLQGVSGSGRALGSGTRWTAASAMTGCSWWALDWAWSQAKLPNGIPSRYTQEGEGAPVFDPRRAVAYGGTHVLTDQSTWEYSPLDSNGQPIGRNNALQMLAYLIGYRIQSPQTGVFHLVGGRGVNAADINLDSFIEAANNCELEGWYSDCVLSTGDSHQTNEGILEAASQGHLVDTGGRWSYWVATDDTGDIAITLTPDDFEGDQYEWVPRRPMSEQFNEVAGTYIDPGALYQARPFPLIYNDTYYAEDGFKKRTTVPLTAVQDVVQAQKLMRIMLNASRRQGVFRATFKWRALKAENYDCIRLTFPPLGFSNKLFRIIEMGLAPGGIDLTLAEEDGAVYLGGTILPYAPPSAGVGYDASQKIALAGFDAIPWGVVGDDEDSARDALYVFWTTGPENVRRTELRYRVVGSVPWTPIAPVLRDQNVVVIEPLLPRTPYEVQGRHVSVNEVPGDWITVTRTTDEVTIDPTTGVIRYSDGTDINLLRPAEINANRTQAHIAAGFAGQTSWATLTLPTNYLTAVAPNIVPGGGMGQGAVDWSLSNWAYTPGLGQGPYLFTSVGGTNAAASKVFEVTAGEVYTLQAELITSGMTAGNLSLDVVWLDSSNALVAYSDRATLGPGQPWTASAVTLTAPAGAARAYARVFTEGSTNTLSGARRVKMAKWPTVTLFTDEASGSRVYRQQAEPLNPSRNDIWVVLDGAGVAIAIRNWTGFAWVNSSDITGLNIAAGFTGQGTLATLNQVTWATQVTGVGRPEDYANRSRIFRSQTQPNPTPAVGVNDIWIILNGSGVDIAVAVWNGSVWVQASDVTLFNIAAGFTGQGPGATATGPNVLNSFLFGPNSNRVNLSNFDRGTSGWTIPFNPLALPAVLTRGVYLGIPFLKNTVTFTGAGQAVSHGTEQGIYRAYCTPGERLAVRCGIELQGVVEHVDFGVLFWDANGTYISTASTQYSPPRYGPQAYNTVIGGFLTVPPGAVTCTLEHYMYSSGAGSAASVIIQPMIVSANESQVILPPYTAGPSAVPGADPTGDNIAAGFTGQGALASLNQVTWATQVTGVGRPEDYATRTRVFQSVTNPTPTPAVGVNDIWVVLNGSGQQIAIRVWNGSAWVQASDVTGFNVAAGFVGQTQWATLDLPTSYLRTPSTNLLYDGGLTQRAAAWALGPAWTWINEAGGPPYLQNGSSGTLVTYTNAFVVNPGTYYFMQAELFAAGVYSGNLIMDIEWLNSGGATTAYSDRIISNQGNTVGWQEKGLAVLAPGDAVAARVRIFLEGAGNNNAGARRIKVSPNTTLTVFTDEATAFARLRFVDSNGRLIDGRGLPINAASGAAIVLVPTAPLSPGGDPATQVNVAALTATLVGNFSLYFPSTTVYGLAENTTYAFFRDLLTASYVAVNGVTTVYFTSADRYLFIGYQTTSLAGGTYSPPPPPPPGGGGGYCPEENTPVTLADGSTRRAGDLVAGDVVSTFHHETLEPMQAAVVAAGSKDDFCLEVELVDGRRLVTSEGHRVFSGRRGWTEVRYLQQGEPLMGLQPGVVKNVTPAGSRKVVRITIESAQSYMTEGVLSHNIKPDYFIP